MANIKGTGLLSVLEGLRANRPQVEGLLEHRCQDYLKGNVLAASWYPAEDFFELCRAFAHFAPAEIDDAWIWMGSRSASVDLGQIYSAMLQQGNPWGTLQRLPRLWRLYHDSGELEVGISGAHEALVTVREFAYVDDRFGRWMAGYLEEMLRLAGADDTSVELRSRQQNSASWRASWSG